MSEFTIGGEIRSALSHFALYGLAAIYEEQLGAQARLWWTEERRPRGQLDVAPEADISDAVRQHAQNHTNSSSWVRQRINHEDRLTATLSPRIKAPSSAAAYPSSGPSWAPAPWSMPPTCSAPMASMPRACTAC